jgi:hypothetical protein
MSNITTLADTIRELQCSKLSSRGFGKDPRDVVLAMIVQDRNGDYLDVGDQAQTVDDQVQTVDDQVKALMRLNQANMQEKQTRSAIVLLLGTCNLPALPAPPRPGRSFLLHLLKWPPFLILLLFWLYLGFYLWFI